MARDAPQSAQERPKRVPLSYRPEDDGDLLLACQDRRWRLMSGQIYRIMTKGSEDEPGSVQPFVPNRAQRMFLSQLHYRNVILKARQLGFCVAPETRVVALDPDGTPRWERIDALNPGDLVLSCDEEPRRHAPGLPPSRKITPTTVIASQSRTAERIRIDFEDGRSLVCTDEHPILAVPPGSDGFDGLAWRTASGRGNGSHARAGGGGGTGHRVPCGRYRTPLPPRPPAVFCWPCRAAPHFFIFFGLLRLARS